MTKFIYILILVFIIAGVIFFIPSDRQNNDSRESNKNAVQPPPPPPETAMEKIPENSHMVKMLSDRYEPGEITIKKGETITWVNEAQKAHWPASNIHPTHGIYPEFDPLEPIPAGSSWSFTFDKAGSWRCHDHLMISIKCKVEVTE